VTIEVRLFAILKERAGVDRVEVDLAEPATVADAIAALAQLPGLSALAKGGARMAVNREYATDDVLLKPSDELALIPPVSGGDAGAHMVAGTQGVHAAVTSMPLVLEPLVQMVGDKHAGAVVSFQGFPRDIPVLEYEAYAEMALETILSILIETKERHGLCHVAAEHRIGPVEAFEASIAIAVSAPHRSEAFAGARDALDRIKAEAPIWKVEVEADGARTRVDGVLPR
jgi:molybdopterin converting factor subunit 1